MHDELFLKILVISIVQLCVYIIHIYQYFPNIFDKLDQKFLKKLSSQDPVTVDWKWKICTQHAIDELFEVHSQTIPLTQTEHGTQMRFRDERCWNQKIATHPRFPSNRGSWQRHVIPLAHHANTIPPRNGTTSPFGFSARPAIMPALETEWLVTSWTSATYRVSNRCHFKRLSFLGTRASSVLRGTMRKNSRPLRTAMDVHEEDGDNVATASG